MHAFSIVRDRVCSRGERFVVRLRSRAPGCARDEAGAREPEAGTVQEGRRRRHRRHARVHAADERPGVQLRRAGLSGIRDVEVPDRRASRRTASRFRKGSAGIPTAWMASWGSGKPVIALGSDIDCIPQASQKPGVAYHDPIIEGAPGHGEGHNSGMPLNITAALAVKKIMERDHLSGHDPALAGRRRGAPRGEGVLRPRRRLQGRRRGALRARRREHGRELGRRHAATASCRSSTRSRARARTPPARRGAAARRSTPSS